MKGYTSRKYEGILLGLQIRRQIGKNKIFRIRHGNGFYGSVLGELIQDQYVYFVPGSINNPEGEWARVALRAAVLAWQGLSEADKNEWRAKEKSYPGTTGYALFVGDWIRRTIPVAKFIEDADQDTRVDTELNADEDKIRFKTANVERGVIDDGGLVTTYGFFHDRGDPANWDFGLGDFTTNGAWHDLDLSGVVPSGAKAVAMRAYLVDNLVDSMMYIRKKGNSFNRNSTNIRIQVANIPFAVDFIVVCDVNRKIEYRTTNTVFADISLNIKGWWK